MRPIPTSSISRKYRDRGPQASALPILLALLLVFGACTGEPEAGETTNRGGGSAAEGSSSRGRPGAGRPGGGGPGGGGSGGWPGAGAAESAIPVRAESVQRGSIALTFETQGTLEAEQDVEIVARAAGPVVELSTEEGRRVRRGDLLARLDDSEIRAQLAAAEARLLEARKTFERTQALFEGELVSRGDLDAAEATFESILGERERLEVQLQHTKITAPFGGLLTRRHVRFAEFVSVGQALFRLTDFEPLLCLVQVPERELSRLRPNQVAHLEVEAWPDRRFEARILRISPVVDPETGTVRVTLEATGEGLLRPGMFASVFLEMERREGTLVIPRDALALDSLGDTVFAIGEGGKAERRSLELGFESADEVEILQGLEEGERIVVLGQDSLSDGTPVTILEGPGAATAQRPSGAPGARPGAAPRDGPPRGRAGAPPFPRGDLNDPETLKAMRERMRERGFSDEEIDQRLERMKARFQGGGRS